MQGYAAKMVQMIWMTVPQCVTAAAPRTSDRFPPATRAKDPTNGPIHAYLHAVRAVREG